MKLPLENSLKVFNYHGEYSPPKEEKWIVLKGRNTVSCMIRLQKKIISAAFRELSHWNVDTKIVYTRNNQNRLQVCTPLSTIWLFDTTKNDTV